MSDNDIATYTRWNPPGRKELSYRAGTYTTVLSRLMTYLTEHQDPQNEVPELQLNTDPQENWGVGLLQAWAIVIDVLTFYQERIANEGFLSTATERRSGRTNGAVPERSRRKARAGDRQPESTAHLRDRRP